MTFDASEREKRSRHCVEVGRALSIFTAKMPELAVENVVVHPLVLLSVVDHFNRSVNSSCEISLCCGLVV